VVVNGSAEKNGLAYFRRRKKSFVALTTDGDDTQTDAADNEQQQYIPPLRFVTCTLSSFLKIGNAILSLYSG
jgi:hypothetical protein